MRTGRPPAGSAAPTRVASGSPPSVEPLARAPCCQGSGDPCDLADLEPLTPASRQASEEFPSLQVRAQLKFDNTLRMRLHS